jgi:hypothetical protein
LGLWVAIAVNAVVVSGLFIGVLFAIPNALSRERLRQLNIGAMQPPSSSNGRPNA